MMKFLKVFLVVIGTFSFAIACGNGGGGGGGTTSPGISYTGSTSQATLTQTNSQDIATGAYQGGQAGAAAVSLGAVQSVEENKITRSRPFMVYQGLERALHEIDIASHSGGVSSGIVTNDSDRIYGDCGGYADYNINYDTVTGNFSGSLIFYTYCSSNTILSGTTNFSGEMNINTKQLINFNFSFENLSGSYAGDSVTLRGEMVCDFSSPNTTVTMTMLIRDDASGDVYKVENYVMDMTVGASYIDVVVSGKYYDPIYGYVDISTPGALRIYDTDQWPSQGTLLCSGNSGTAAQLEVISKSQYRVIADTDGDGSFNDYNSGDLNWNDL